MLSNGLKSDRIWFFLFLGMPFLYFALYGSYGFSDTDQGFIQGLSWRVLEGEMPHWTFIYVRPSLSPLLHAAELAVLPENHAIWLSRLVFWLMLWASVCLALLSLKPWGSIRELTGLPLGLLGAVAFVLTAHNYPPMPWHTVDGVFFASVGIFLLTRGEKWIFLLGGLVALGLSAACKQPFFLAPPIGMLLVGILYGRKKGLLYLGLNVLAIGGLVLGMRTVYADQMGPLMEQISGQSKLADLLQAGFGAYVKALVFWILPLGFSLFLLPKIKGGKKYYAALPWLFLLFLEGMVILHGFWAMQEQSSIAPRWGYVQGIFLAGLALSLWAVWKKEKLAWVLLAQLGIAWASGISWGYQTPILFITPALVAILWGLKKLANAPLKMNMAASLLMILLIGFGLMFRFPYGDGPKTEERKHLGELFPRMSGIWTAPEHYEKYRQLKSLREEHDQPFVVLPAMPLAHYLFGEASPIQIDWAHNAEMDWTHNRNLILNKLNFIEPVVFLEKERMHELELEGKYGSALARYVKENWSKTYETQYFEVFLP